MNTLASSTKTHWFRDVLILTLLIGIFYTAMLGSRPLTTPDEGRYSEISREMVVSGDYVTPRLNGVVFFDKPILFKKAKD